MNELEKIHPILNRLEELNKSKFNSSNFVALNKEFRSTLDHIVEQIKSQVKKELKIEDKKIFLI